MKLLSCHIAGFGKLENRAFDLSQDLVQIKAENGWGKTTFADFIECMFYGLDGSKKKNVAENDRAKYAPWSGGAFGGSLTFICGGKTYRVERTFGKTSAADTARVYDKNNMLCYDFGERAERLGEMVFGVDRESYRRSTYIPQDEIQTDGFTNDVREKLRSLLSGGARGDSGGKDALELLDEADRALRSKRNPRRGKLDEIDDRLASLAGLKAECNNAAELGRAEENEASACAQKLETLQRELVGLNARLETLSRQREREASRAAYEEIKKNVSAAEDALVRLKDFFGNVDPATVNTEGLKDALAAYYAEEKRAEELRLRIQDGTVKLAKINELKTKLSACEKTLANFELLLKAESKSKGAGKGSKPEKRKKMGNFSAFLLLLLSVASLCYGVSQISASPIAGALFLLFGAGGTLCSLFSFLRNAFSRKDKTESAFADKEMNERYAETRAEQKRLQEQLAAFPENAEKEQAEREAEYTESKTRADALKTAVENFFKNFAFSEIYDYRAAYDTLTANIQAYKAYGKTVSENTGKLAAYAQQTDANEVDQEQNAPFSAYETERKKAELERERERLTAERAARLARAETYGKQAEKKGELIAEESLLLEEKERLEKRLTAIRAARELLVRARGNMATKYLEPVENACRRYAQAMGMNASELLRFDANGRPLLEENGALRVAEYYSAGTRGLLDFCVRIALAEALFSGETPPLVLDDPFTDLDDDKTEKGKRLIKELSRKYQVIYLTCKAERAL